MSREDTIYQAIDKAPPGEIWECGVFRGDNALNMRAHIAGRRTLRLFDTFTGQPYSGPHDTHEVGSMNDTSLELVQARFAGDASVIIHPGAMPSTFVGLEGSIIAAVNIDVDNHDSVKACLEFIYPRVPSGGYIILDDYGCGSCPGAKLATDQFLSDKPETLSPNREGPQAFFIKI